MSQQEDDLRALAKIMDFLRAVSIILVVMNVYWFCYEAIRLWGVDIGVVDRILMNFNRTAGLFRSILYTKLFANRSRAPFPKYALRRTEFRQYRSNRAYLTTFILSARENFCRRYRKCLPPCQRLLLYAVVIRRWQYHCGS